MEQIQKLHDVVRSVMPQFTTIVDNKCKSNYHPEYGGISSGFSLVKVVFSNNENQYLVFLPDEVFLVHNEKFRFQKPLKGSTIIWQARWSGFYFINFVADILEGVSNNFNQFFQHRQDQHTGV